MGSGRRAGSWGKSFDISGTSDRLVFSRASEMIVILTVLQHDIDVIKT